MIKTITIILLILAIISCGSMFAGNDINDIPPPQSPQLPPLPTDSSAILLRHSTGGNLFDYGGGAPNNGVVGFFSDYNNVNGTDYNIQMRAYPGSGYPWENYPYDYWNIFVYHGDEFTFSGQDTLRTLTQDFDIIIWKHCYPGADILNDIGSPNISSNRKSLENYKLQYEALKTEMHKYPDTRFIVWTLALQTESGMNSTDRINSLAFVDWVRDVWDDPGDNIFLWDLYFLETNKEAVQYLVYPSNPSDSHPSNAFNNAAGPLFAQRVIDVIRGEGDMKPITGETSLGGDWNLIP